MKPWTILAPVTTQRSDSSAIRYPIGVANALGARLSLLHIHDSAKMSNSSRAVDEDRADLVSAIARYAEEIDADLILIPAARSVWSPVRRSLASRLLSSTPRAVQLWTPSAEAAPFRCRQLVCVLELDGSDGPLIAAANEFAARTGASVEALHVVPIPSESLLFHAVDELHRPLSISAASTRLDKVRYQLPFPHTTSIVMGERQKSIALSARRKSADLVLVGRKIGSAGPAAGWEMSGILKRAGCPVVSVPLREAEAQGFQPLAVERRKASSNSVEERDLTVGISALVECPGAGVFAEHSL